MTAAGALHHVVCRGAGSEVLGCLRDCLGSGLEGGAQVGHDPLLVVAERLADDPVQRQVEVRDDRVRVLLGAEVGCGLVNQHRDVAGSDVAGLERGLEVVARLA